jgi:glycosyltransferase involved in cell wall biosynthesis
MKICFIGKYPPIEGGVSVQSYWSVRGLAARGHEVSVVTNADEVEDAYRLHLEDEDRQWLEPRFESGRGLVRVRNAERFSPRRMAHIPVANPFVTKLASIATQTIRQHGCEVIYASYMEPYGVAAYLASQWTDTPYVVKHAGSDLDRLMKVPDLSTAYREVFRRASRVQTTSNLTERFARMGVEDGRIRADIGFSLPAEIFNPSANPLDVNGFLGRLAERAPARIRELIKSQPRPIDLSKPTIGIYGKAGEFKGTYDLISALALLKRKGLDFNLLAMTHGSQGERFRRVLRETGMEDRTWTLPFIPHWKVPGFIRACTAVCFLERDFPIAIHGPMIAREVLTCGVCLILSREIASKQSYRDQLVDRENVLLVADPKDHDELAASLSFVIENPEAARQIGAQGHIISKSFEDESAYVRRLENLLLEASGGAPAFAADDKAKAHSNGKGELAGAIARALPCTSFLLSDQFDDALAGYRDASPRQNVGGVKAAVNFCGFLETRSPTDASRPASPYFLEVLRLEKIALSLPHENGGGRPTPPFSGVDRLIGRQVTEETVAHLRPLKSNHCHIAQFEYDMLELVTLLRQNQLPPETPQKKDTLLLFHTAPNLTASIVRINGSTKNLLRLCDGEHTTGSLLAELARLYDPDPEAGGGQFKRDVISTLGHLYQKGVIIFC